MPCSAVCVGCGTVGELVSVVLAVRLVNRVVVGLPPAVMDSSAYLRIVGERSLLAVGCGGDGWG